MTRKILCSKCGEKFNWTDYLKHLEEKYLPNSSDFLYQTEQELSSTLKFGHVSEDSRVCYKKLIGTERKFSEKIITPLSMVW